ncbi:SsrA-binding protein [Algimonas ampicilliniresistens]|uniref:SsrA-binding protein n=1 Tax=Algimonas ampicilliniresistens TaxID=1298735 RepID=A0ABQ5V645_9PROT|nr:SsrA-binding protein SmpB [Algimonas ampicilliniresistens]GLQ22984.1 SsrA-binding protein [Algimonas ampicilliniresistens]
MAVKKKPSVGDNGTLIAENRRARYDFAIEETMEAGVSLLGTEVKSLRSGKANIAESYVDVDGSEAWLVNANIPIYEPAAQFNHSPKRGRKLLLKRKEINTLIGETQRKGRTVIPLKMYFNKDGRVKLLIGVAAGKQQHDKRDVQKTRDWQKQKARLLRDRG